MRQSPSSNDPPSDSPPGRRLAPVVPLVRDDAGLVFALGKADRHAPAQLFDRYGAQVERLLRRLLGRAESEIGDLLHDVFVRALESIHRLRDPRALRPWLMSITVLTAREWLRRKKRRGTLQAPEVVETMTGHSVPPEARAAVRSLYALLDTLGPDERVAFVLRSIERMELQEVADACGVSMSTARRRIARADEQFRERLPDYPALLELVKGPGQ